MCIGSLEINQTPLCIRVLGATVGMFQELSLNKNKETLEQTWSTNIHCYLA